MNTMEAKNVPNIGYVVNGDLSLEI